MGEQVPLRGREFAPRRIYKSERLRKARLHPRLQRLCLDRDGRRAACSAHRACRTRIEEVIAANGNDDRSEKVKERFDRYAAQKVKEGNQRGGDPRQPEEPAACATPEVKVDVDKDEVPMEFDIRTPGRASSHAEDLVEDELA